MTATSIEAPTNIPSALTIQQTNAKSEADISANQPRKPKLWIYGPIRDFFLIHGGIGLVTLPVVAASFMAPESIGGLLLIYTLTLGLPHLTATHVRLHLDQDCRDRHQWLAVAAPLGVAALVATIVYSWKLLPLFVLGWFLTQSWHANRQNFGIMRRYIRMSGSEPTKPVNRLAEAGIELLPWASVCTALMIPTKQYFNYPIAMPPTQFLIPALVVLWAASVVVVTAYIACECYEWFRGRSVPGRVLCFASGAIINVTAWVLVEDIVWGYLVVSTWHALQYLAYVHSFRAAPPPGAKVLKLTFKPHIALLFVGGLAFFFAAKGIEFWIPPALVVFHLGLNFHHYLADAFIWRAPKLALSK